MYGGGDLALKSDGRLKGGGGPGASGRKPLTIVCSGAFVCIERTSQNWFPVTVCTCLLTACGRIRNTVKNQLLLQVSKIENKLLLARSLCQVLSPSQNVFGDSNYPQSLPPTHHLVSKLVCDLPCLRNGGWVCEPMILIRMAFL